VTEGAESLYAGQIEVLEQVASGAPLPQVLDAVVRLVEGQAPGMLCSILLFEPKDRSLHLGAGPRLPPDYARAIDGATIGPEAGSCGAAAQRGEPVIVEDIATDPLWTDYRRLALSHGLLACWSTPIFSPERRLLGTFAMYYRERRRPHASEIAWVAAATHLGAIAIVRDQAEQSLRTSEARARQLARLYAVSSRVNEAVVRLRDPQELYDIACRIAVEEGLARLAWVGAYDAAEDRIKPLARFGHDAGYVDAILLGLRDDRVNRGPAALAIRMRQISISDDVAADPAFY
jgi:hypothetical protein